MPKVTKFVLFAVSCLALAGCSLFGSAPAVPLPAELTELRNKVEGALTDARAVAASLKSLQDEPSLVRALNAVRASLEAAQSAGEVGADVCAKLPADLRNQEPCPTFDKVPAAVEAVKAKVRELLEVDAQHLLGTGGAGGSAS
jgi:hypothetical protein